MHGQQNGPDVQNVGGMIQRRRVTEKVSSRMSAESAALVRSFSVDPGRIVMVPAAASVAKAHRLIGTYKLAYDALVRAVDDANQAGQALPKVSDGLSERVSVDLWISEFTRFRSDGSDISSDTIRRSFDRAKGHLQALKIIGVYDNLAWIDWQASDKSDNSSDK